MKTFYRIIAALALLIFLQFMIGRALDIEAAGDAERVQQFLAK